MKKSIIMLVLLMGLSSVFADGLMVPVEENYPKDFLKNRMTKVVVNLYGTVAVTQVTQEFINESNFTTDAVYSFPLPPNARATEFLYWYKDEPYRAVLKVREQANNPGTGEGGIIALVNDYIGRNGIRIQLRDIEAGHIQKVRLTYIQNCDYFRGKITYQYPLDTSDFITLPIDHLQFTINVYNSAAITNLASPSHPDITITKNEEHYKSVEIIYPKYYLDRDVEFYYEIDDSETFVNFYSVANDSMDGHFGLFMQPVSEIQSESVFPKRIIFLLENNRNISGYAWDQSLKTIEHCIGLLDDNDKFNIGVFNYNASFWKSGPVSPTEDNINDAKVYLSNLSTRSGSNLENGLNSALQQITDDEYNNSIIVYTTGYSYIDPVAIENNNTYKTGIFPIGLGENLQRERLEMTAGLNYGFVTYFDEDDNLYDGMTKVFEKISLPILQDVAFEFGRTDLYDLLPAKIPTTFAGTQFYMTGRYDTPGTTALAMAGLSKNGTESFGFQLDFSDKTNENKFAESLWAREKIDALEREIEIYGENSQKKQELIDLSLRYNIRCRYTAYVADYETPYTGIEQEDNSGVQVPVSYLVGNFPNPFNPSTTIRFYLSPLSKDVSTKLIKIFNALGQLVAVIDISHMEAGMHEIRFNGLDFSGNPLPSGTYFVFLQVGEQISSTRITLLK